MELELSRQANLDGLTEIANRRCFDEQFKKEWRRCHREQRPLALMMCDVDHFKLYNDTYGHQMGDECLKHIADALLRVTKRPGDVVARYGGEEFVVILPSTDSDGARQVAEALQDELQRLKIPHASSSVNPYVTLSIGVAGMLPTRECALDKLLGIADEALYQAKENGRNRIIVRNCECQ
jgi:diguanylate cyclase (GGDEF)-like protein